MEENNYSYNKLIEDISGLKSKYSFLQTGSIGYSVLGKQIPYLRFGNGRKKVMYFASIHANEWITSPLLMKFLEDLCESYSNNSAIYGYSTSYLFNRVSLYIVPMLNPDGVDLVTGAIKPNTSIYKNFKAIANYFPDIPFPDGWKANFNGIDLNLQFPAGWQKAKEIKYLQGFNKPAPRDFVGLGPLTEPESLAIYNFTLIHNFELTISYHTQGKEIYWQFQNYAPKYAEEIGKIFASVSGYTLTQPVFNSSFAGYKDWFIQNYKLPGYTIEAGFGQNPLPITQFNEIYNDNLGILVLGMVL